jgi:hypothetical protein
MANIPRLCERLTTLSESYFDKNFALANPILERLVEECIEFHNEILIEDACANEFFDLNMIRAENKEIRRNFVENNTTILSRSSISSWGNSASIKAFTVQETSSAFFVSGRAV